MCYETGLHYQWKKAELLLLPPQRHQTGQKCCPVGKVWFATIEDTVKEQARKIFDSPLFLEKSPQKPA